MSPAIKSPAMSSDPDQVSGDIRRHVSRTVNLRCRNTGSLKDLRNPNPLNSSWIRRLHVTSSPPPPPCTRTISSHESRTAVRYLARVSRSEEESRLHVTSSTPPPPRTRTISSHESRTAVRYLARVSRSEEEKSKEVSGFGPYKFKARSARESTKEKGLNTDRGLEKREDLGFKISPFFRILPPMAKNSELTLSNPSS